MSGSVKIARKIILYLLLFLLILIGGLTIYLRFNKEQIEQNILTSINEQQSGYLIYEGLEVGTTGSFPLVSLTFNGVNYFETPDTTSAPILKVNKFSVVPNVVALLKGNFVIDKINLSGVTLNLVEDANGDLNLIKAIKNPFEINEKPRVQDSTSMDNEVLIDIKKFEIKDVHIVLKDNRQQAIGYAQIDQLLGGFSKQAETEKMFVALYADFDQFNYGDIELKKHVTFEITTDFNSAPSMAEYYINNTRIKLNDEIQISAKSAKASHEQATIQVDAMFEAKDLIELLFALGMVGEDFEAMGGDVSVAANLTNVSMNDLPDISLQLDLNNFEAVANENPLSLNMESNLIFSSIKKQWKAELSALTASFKKNELKGEMIIEGDSSDHINMTSSLAFLLFEENAADTIYSEMSITSLFSFDIAKNGELIFRDETQLKAEVNGSTFNRQMIEDATVTIAPDGAFLRVHYKTQETIENNIDMKLAVGPFVQKALIPSVDVIPFELLLNASAIDLTYLEVTDLKRIEDLSLKVDGSIGGLESADSILIDLRELELFVADTLFDITAKGDLAILIDTLSDVHLLSDDLSLNGSVDEIALSNMKLSFGRDYESYQSDVMVNQFELPKLGAFLLMDSVNFLMKDSAFFDANLKLAYSTNDSVVSLKANGGMNYLVSGNHFKVGEVILDIAGEVEAELEQLDGEVHINGLELNDYKENPLQFSLAYDKPIADLEITATEDFYEGEGAIKIQVDMSDEPKVRLDYNITNLDLATFWGRYQEVKFIDGKADFSINMETYAKHLLDSLQGSATIEGADWQLYGFDLDEILRDYKRSQNFKLTDVGAYLVIGPFGPLVSKGFDFSRLAAIDTTGVTKINKFKTNWTISNGVIIPEDVAFTSSQNRVAATGAIDLNKGQWNNFKVAVIDKKGCSLLEQEINGALSNPEFGEINVIGTLLGSVINVLKIASFSKCEPFYRGSVSHPN